MRSSARPRASRASTPRPRDHHATAERPSASGLLTVGQTARILGVSPSTLRLWENVGLVAPMRSRGRFRLYTRELVEVLKRIKYLRDVHHLNVHGIKRALQSDGKRRKRPAVPGRDTDGVAAVGPRLRRLRERRGLSIAAVAAQAGISVGFLSAFERREANASVATLHRLASAYGTTLMSLVGGRGRASRVVRPDERKRLKGVPGVRMEFLSRGARLLESMLFRVAPLAGSEGAYAHEGEEFIYMLSGTLEIWLDELECHVLREGDGFWFESTLAHRWFNPGDTDAVLVWINTPPTF